MNTFKTKWNTLTEPTRFVIGFSTIIFVSAMVYMLDVYGVI